MITFVMMPVTFSSCGLAEASMARFSSYYLSIFPGDLGCFKAAKKYFNSSFRSSRAFISRAVTG